MARIPMVAGNWKMNGSVDFTREFLGQLTTTAGEENAVETLLLLPYLYLQTAQQLLNSSNVAWGAQNVSEYAEGAYTGEISGNMLRDFACSYVLVGHSERRSTYLETNSQVAAKFFQAINTGIKPILCVGETLEDRNNATTFNVIEQQLHAVFENSQFKNCMGSGFIIAYEPVWAIGTGKVATPEQVQEIHAFIRQILAKYDNNVANVTRILYGGSVKPENAMEIFKQKDIDGGLVGGASLHSDIFREVISICNRFCLQSTC